MARHGETDDNRPPLCFQGHRDTPLNDTGREQAHALAEKVVGQSVGRLYASPLSRARETAEIVGARIGLEPTLDSRLMEGNRGRWEGRLFADVERAEPEAYAAWRAAEPDFRFPGGESLHEHCERVLAALADIGSAERPALIVSHGGSIRMALCHTSMRGLEAFHEWDVPNGALIEL
ncbi:MAG TPA: histidine phosphatase family protein [Solirubrobacteraceae bacterium]|nr:histidine phosphatase family protein [Solirubrobacteraceae bacterium]